MSAPHTVLSRLGTIAATVAFATAAGLAPTAAQAAPGDTTNICYSTLTPSGWVDINWYHTTPCGGGSFSKNTITIKQIAGYPVGTITLACGSSLTPSGWVDNGSWFYRSSCAMSNSQSNNARNIRRVS